MNDRELLEMAAKAAGYVLDDDWDFDESWGFRVLNCSEWWNPLTDDGDALRLAVKLRLQITHYARQVRVWHGKVGATYESVGASRDEATRRAIARVAAEIGKAMP